MDIIELHPLIHAVTNIKPTRVWTSDTLIHIQSDGNLVCTYTKMDIINLLWRAR